MQRTLNISMTTSYIYTVKFWIRDEERPWIDFGSIENNPPISWLDIGRILNGEAPAHEYLPIHLFTQEDDGQIWHSYEVAGTFGLLSNEVIDLVREFIVPWFDLLNATINNRQFCFLRKKTDLDCLDRKNSTIVPFPHQPNSIMRIDRYRFLKGRIPDDAIFSIPEMRWHLFATDSIKRMISHRHFKGIYFIDAETDR